MRDDALPFHRFLAVAGAIAAAVAAAIAVALLLMRHEGLPPGGLAVTRPVEPPGQPALQTAPQLDLAAYRREKARAASEAGG